MHLGCLLGSCYSRVAADVYIGVLGGELWLMLAELLRGDVADACWGAVADALGAAEKDRVMHIPGYLVGSCSQCIHLGWLVGACGWGAMANAWWERS